MRYADTLLTEGENVVLRTRQHWLALLVRSRAAVALWLLGLLLLGAVVFLNITDVNLRNIVSLVAGILIVIGLVIFIYRLWQWWAQDYVVTNRRLLKVTGILNKRSGDSSLEKINDAILLQPLLGRILNYGDLEILTAADAANDYYRMLNAPKEFKKVMLTQKHSLETEYVYGRPPSPPLRATTEAPAPPLPPSMPPREPVRAEASAVPAAPPPPAMPPPAVAEGDGEPAPRAEMADEDEESVRVTETLARLADLRDKGAITPEEYEQKKDELLGRL